MHTKHSRGTREQAEFKFTHGIRDVLFCISEDSGNKILDIQMLQLVHITVHVIHKCYIAYALRVRNMSCATTSEIRQAHVLLIVLTYA